MLESTLRRASEHRPEFVQMTTWNDYTEGTQIEPSWLRLDNTCLDICGSSCLTTESCDSFGLFTDCTKPLGTSWGPADPSCGIIGNISAWDDYNRVKQHISFERSASAALAAAARR
ncbi:unnamed protein product [Polarella glacialis]|uniref:Apple domain-containing protein n=2 Tax=Polarella glacialis TaxID=89957 RepID=A0A813GRT6_POLGL|nr:unnamed protein product [Polarella glacialis]